MWMLVPEEDVLLVAYLIPKRVPTDNQIIGFNLSLPMGYINSAAYFCMKKNTIADLSNFTILERHEAPPHPLNTIAYTRALEDKGAQTVAEDTTCSNLTIAQCAKALTIFGFLPI